MLTKIKNATKDILLILQEIPKESYYISFVENLRIRRR